MLLRPEQAEGAKGKNVVIGEKRPKDFDDKILGREVVIEKAPGGKELIKITAQVPGGKKVLLLLPVGLFSRTDWSDRFCRPVRLVSPRDDLGPSIPSARKWVLERVMSQMLGKIC